MNLGVIGSGKIVPEFLSVCKEFKEINLEAICGTKRSIEKTLKIKDDFNINMACSDIEEFLKSNIDVVYVAVPNNLHFEIAKVVLENGKHVILEKPFTSTLQEAEELIAIAKSKKLIIFEAISNQYLPTYLETKKLLSSLGDIKIVEINYSQYSSRYDAFKQGEIAPVFDKEKGGGALVDLGVYNIYFLIGLFGKPINVIYMPNMERGVDTSGIMLMDYGSFKCVSICAKDCKAPLNINIQGDKGCIYSPSASNRYTHFVHSTNSGEETTFDLNNNKHRLYFELENFLYNFTEKNYDWFNKQNLKTLDVMEVLEQARH